MGTRFGPRGLRVTPPRVLAVALLAILVSVGLLAHHDTPNVFRAIALLAHVALGLVVVPLALFALYELYKRRVAEFPVGHALVLVSGAAVLVLGGARTHADVLAAHAAIGAAFAVWSLVPRRAAFLGAPLAFFAAHHLVLVRATEVPRTEEPIAAIDADARPTGRVVVDATALAPADAARFLDEARCLPCHKTIDPARHVGGHGRAPTFADERGTDASCASCHDPARAVRARAAPTPSEASTWPCLACHGGAELTFTDDAARLALSLPRDPVVTNDDFFLSFARAITRTDARAHRARMRSTTLRARLSCTSCHTANAHDAPSLGHGAWPLEAAGPGSLLRAPDRVCADCHAQEAPVPALVVAAFPHAKDGTLALDLDAPTTTTTATTTTTLTLLLSNENAGHGFPASPFAAPLRPRVRASDGAPLVGVRLRSASPAARVVDDAIDFVSPLAPGESALFEFTLPTPIATRELAVEFVVPSLRGDRGEALRTARVERSPSPLLLARLAVALVDAGRLDEAARALSRAEASAPFLLDVKRGRAHLLAATGARDDARALLANERDAAARVARALLGDERDTFDATVLAEAHKGAPFDVELTLARVGRGMQPDESRRALRVALAAHPGHPALLAALDALPQ